jgi:hypothetical protein
LRVIDVEPDEVRHATEKFQTCIRDSGSGQIESFQFLHALQLFLNSLAVLAAVNVNYDPFIVNFDYKRIDGGAAEDLDSAYKMKKPPFRLREMAVVYKQVGEIKNRNVRPMRTVVVIDLSPCPDQTS